MDNVKANVVIVAGGYFEVTLLKRHLIPGWSDGNSVLRIGGEFLLRFHPGSRSRSVCRILAVSVFEAGYSEGIHIFLLPVLLALVQDKSEVKWIIALINDMTAINSRSSPHCFVGSIPLQSMAKKRRVV